MATGRGTSGPTKRDRREEARETARRMREEAARKAKRRRVIVQSSVIAGVIAVLAIIGIIVYSGVSASSSVANPANMLSGGLQLTSSTNYVSTPPIAQGAKPTPTTQKLDGKTAHIQIWLDYQCPYCNEFETTNTPQITKWLDAGTATLEVHPVAILDSPTNNQYSTRAAAAAACVAAYDPSKFLAMNTALYANQPNESTGSGLPNSKILSIFKGVGIDSQQISDCVNKQTYAKFITDRTNEAVNSSQLKNPTQGGFGTPTVFVNGERYNGGFTDATQFANFVQTAVKDAGSTGSVTFPTK